MFWGVCLLDLVFFFLSSVRIFISKYERFRGRKVIVFCCWCFFFWRRRVVFLVFVVLVVFLFVGYCSGFRFYSRLVGIFW